MILQPFVYQLRDVLVESGIATPEQGERFIELAEAQERGRVDAQMAEMRAKANGSRSLWQRIKG